MSLPLPRPTFWPKYSTITNSLTFPWDIPNPSFPHLFTPFLKDRLFKSTIPLPNKISKAYTDIPQAVEICKASLAELLKEAEDFTRAIQTGDKKISLALVSEKLKEGFVMIYARIKEEFPPFDQAPTHEEREKPISTVLDHAGEVILNVLVEHGVKEETLRPKVTGLKIVLKRVVLIVGESLAYIL